jgi:hypothetical protein
MRPRNDCARVALSPPRHELLARCVRLALDCPSLERGTDSRDDLSALLGPKQRLPPADEIEPILRRLFYEVGRRDCLTWGKNNRTGDPAKPRPPSPYALRRMRRPVNGRWRGSAKARALATQPNLAVVGNACGGRTDFHGNFQLMLLHCRLRSGRCPQGEQDR